MKRQPGWMAALAAVFLFLCGVIQTAPAQTAGQAKHGGRYYTSDGTDTLVLRLLEASPKNVVYGAGTAIIGPPDPNGTLDEQKIGILGVIKQNIPAPWSGDFEAHWPVFTVPRR